MSLLFQEVIVTKNLHGKKMLLLFDRTSKPRNAGY